MVACSGLWQIGRCGAEGEIRLGSVQPPAGESGRPQPGNDLAAFAHQLPHQPRFVVLDHRDHWSLVDAEVPR